MVMDSLKNYSLMSLIKAGMFLKETQLIQKLNSSQN